jgi:hypothetical protein
LRNTVAPYCKLRTRRIGSKELLSREVGIADSTIARTPSREKTVAWPSGRNALSLRGGKLSDRRQSAWEGNFSSGVENKVRVQTISCVPAACAENHFCSSRLRNTGCSYYEDITEDDSWISERLSCRQANSSSLHNADPSHLPINLQPQ